MTFLTKMFGKKEEKAPTTGEAIQKLRDIEDMLTKKKENLKQRIRQELLIAKKHAALDNKRAIQALKRKKRYEKQLQQNDGTLSTIQMQREALEGSNRYQHSQCCQTKSQKSRG